MITRRDIKAFALAPLPAVTPVLVMFGFIFADVPQDWAEVFGEMLAQIALCYCLTALVGLPVHLLLKRLGRTSLAAYLGLTIAIVLLGGVALAILDRIRWAYMPGDPRNWNPRAIHLWGIQGVALTLVVIVFGLLSASIFWFVAVRQRKS